MMVKRKKLGLIFCHNPIFWKIMLKWPQNYFSRSSSWKRFLILIRSESSDRRGGQSPGSFLKDSLVTVYHYCLHTRRSCLLLRSVNLRHQNSSVLSEEPIEEREHAWTWCYFHRAKAPKTIKPCWLQLSPLQNTCKHFAPRTTFVIFVRWERQLMEKLQPYLWNNCNSITITIHKHKWMIHSNHCASTWKWVYNMVYRLQWTSELSVTTDLTWNLVAPPACCLLLLLLLRSFPWSDARQSQTRQTGTVHRWPRRTRLLF